MFQLIGLVVLAMWSGRKALSVNKNPYVWGMIAAGIYMTSYALILYSINAWLKPLFLQTQSADYAMQIVSLGLIVICFSLSTLIIERILYRSN